MKNKKLIFLIIFFLFLGICGLGAYEGFRFVMDKYHYLRDKITEIDEKAVNDIRQYDFDYSWMEGNVLVAHAFGGKGSKTYTNALEAFNYNYELGHRVFEVDFDLTDDCVTICSHDEDYWRYITGNEDSDIQYTYENFKNSPLFTDYTPMDYKDVVNLLREYPDIYIISDTKYSDELRIYQQFSQIADYAKEVDPEILDRIIPQIYTKSMLDYVMNIHEFKSIIFTLYQITWDAEDIAKFCKRSGIGYITVSSEIIDQETIELWKSMNIRVAVHTVDDEDEANMFLDYGTDMVYTNFLEPEKYNKK